MKILFSPVGSTDPITNSNDGAMLHICRTYRPDKVYLYLSAEMAVYSDRDNRYVKSIELLQELLDWKCSIEIIRDDEMIDVHIFDAFINPFENILDKIISIENPEILYLNISSGTPAMKSALQLLSILWSRTCAIQVSTPAKASNTVHEDKNNYDLELQWEMNADNNVNFNNRCKESDAKRLLDRIHKEKIISLIKDYDYEAALVIVGKMANQPSDLFVSLLNIAIERQKLSISWPRLIQYKKEFPIENWFPKLNASESKDFEFLASMQNKLNRKQYVDFARDITPILFSLSEKILLKECDIAITDICNYDKRTDAYKIDFEKIRDKGINLDHKFDERIITADIIIKIIMDLQIRQEIMELLVFVRDSEIHIRNKSAHEIIGLTYEEIKQRIQCTPEKLMEQLYKLAISSGIKITDNAKNTYQVMNNDLIDVLIRE